MCGIKIKRRFKIDGRTFRITKQYSYSMSYEAFYTGYISPADLLGKTVKLRNKYNSLHEYKVIEVSNKTMPVSNNKYIKRTYIILISEDTRQLYYYWQRDRRGFDGSDMWNLEAKILEWLIPRLECFVKVSKGHGWPVLKNGIVEYSDGSNLAEEMLTGFKIYQEKDSWDKKDTQLVNRAFNLFKKHFSDLWT